jgi:hypothetical protein
MPRQAARENRPTTCFTVRTFLSMARHLTVSTMTLARRVDETFRKLSDGQAEAPAVPYREPCELDGAGARPSWPAQGRVRDAPARPDPASGSLGQTLGRSLHRLGRRRTSRARLPRPLRVPDRHQQYPHRRPRRPGRDHPPQAPQVQPVADHPPPWPRVHAPVPAARPAHKVRYFGLWHHTRREQAARGRLLLQLARPTTGRQAEAIEVAADPAAGQAQPQICRRCKQAS